MPRGKKATNTTSKSDVENKAKDLEVETKNETKEKEVEKKEEVIVEPLTNNTEIEVKALRGGVSYYDKATGDRYVWEHEGDVEIMTFETLKNMHRTYRSYFTNLLIKPLDERVFDALKLRSIYEKYEYVFNIANYTKDEIENTIEQIKTIPTELKFTIFARITNWVTDGEISDIKVIKALERKFGLDLVELI